MFAPHCSACDRRVLLGQHHLLELHHRDGRHEATLRCRCGARVRWVAPRGAATNP